MTNTIQIKKGTIKCKFCSKDYPDMLAAYNCICQGKSKVKWGRPSYRRKTLIIKKIREDKNEY